MKILKIKIVNYKKIVVFEADLDGNNLAVAGSTGQGKTTAISVLWDIMERVSDPLQHGKDAGKIEVVLGEAGNPIEVIAERKFTAKSNTITITSTDGKRIGADEFKSWFSRLGVNPHDLMQLKPMEFTNTLLSCVQYPKGMTPPDELDRQRADLATQRKDLATKLSMLKGAIAIEPPKLKGRVQSAGEIQERQRAILNAIQNAETAATSIRIHEQTIRNLNEEQDRLLKRLDEILESITESTNAIQSFKEKLAQVDVTALTIEKDSCEQSLRDIETTTRQQAAREAYEVNFTKYQAVKGEYDLLDQAIVGIDQAKKDAVNSALWPISGLGITDGQITYNGNLLTNCGESEILLVCAALAASLAKDSKLQVVRMDGVESMSRDDFKRMCEIFKERGVQVLSSRVDRDGQAEEGELLIEDGRVVE